MRRRHWRTLLLVAAVLGGASLVIGAQEQGKAEKAGGRDVFIQTVTNGQFRFGVTNVGRITNIETPVGTAHNGHSEYELCTQGGNYEGSNDFAQHGGISQPNGAGTLPLTITARTLDARWEIKWSYTVDTAEHELLVTAVVKRLANWASWAYLQQGTDFDMNAHTSNAYDRSTKTAWQRGTVGSLHAMAMFASSGGTMQHYVYATAFGNIYTDNNCFPGNAALPGVGDVAGSITYYLGNMGSGTAKTVKYQYRRL